MPLYDYKCTDCGTQFTLLMGVVAEGPNETCPHCGSGQVSRLISRFSRLRSEDEIVDSLADPSRFGDLDDPEEMRGFMRNAASELGDDLGDDFDEALDEAESAGAL